MLERVDGDERTNFNALSGFRIIASQASLKLVVLVTIVNLPYRKNRPNYTPELLSSCYL